MSSIEEMESELLVTPSGPQSYDCESLLLSLSLPFDKLSRGD
eukprot:COSAG01_NODE_39187_length_479_cov_9.823684_1_plen_41_part_01